MLRTNIFSVLILSCICCVSAANPIHIFMGADDNYTMPTSVAMSSTLANHPGNDIMFHIYDFGMSHKSKDILTSVCSKKAELEFIPFSYETVKGLGMNICNAWPLGVFAKYWIPIYSQERGIDKAIWLDGDTVVNGDIKRLWDIELGDNYIAGVKEVAVELSKAFCGTLQSGFCVLNAGVLLFNCKKMGDYEMLEKLRQKTLELSDKVIAVEQEVLSSVTANHQIILPMEFNFQTLLQGVYGLTDAASYSDDSSQSLAAAAFRSIRKRVPLPSIEDVLVYHYAGKGKPWTLMGGFVPFTDLWYKYLRRTPFWGFKESLKEEVAAQSSRLFDRAVRAVGFIGKALVFKIQ
ncbi:MAG: glycosyltransferase family 8 protein [Holosporales bacterium]|nr:glycosyltransferase family 8 protein [Holosporales bacterium]